MKMMKYRLHRLLAGLLAGILVFSAPLSVLAETGGFPVPETQKQESGSTADETGSAAFTGVSTSGEPEAASFAASAEDPAPEESDGAGSDDIAASPSDAPAPAQEKPEVSTPSNAKGNEDFTVKDHVLTAYTGTDTDVVIPNDLGITAIGQNAFKNNTDIVSVTFNEDLQSVYYGAFTGCTRLETVKTAAVSASLEIGEDAFNGDTSLETFEAYSEELSIGESAFEGCSNLKTVTIHTSNTDLTLGIYCFRNCTDLSGFSASGDVVFEEEYSYYGDQFSGCTKLASVSLPNGETVISRKAFSGCTKLKSITLPAGTTAINAEAFNGCIALETVNLADLEDLTTIGTDAFKNCDRLTAVILPTGLTSLGNYGFCGCDRLKTVTIQSEILTVSSSAFQDCTVLDKLVIADTAENLTFGSSCFENCTSLKTVSGTGTDTAVTISEEAFRGCTGLTSVSLSGEVSLPAGSWTSSQFQGCTQLKTVSFGTLSTSIPKSAFQDCAALETVLFSASAEVTEIGESAFEGCTRLTSVTIPSSVTVFASYAFKGCTALTAFTFPASLVKIGYEAFSGCTSLKKAIFKSGSTLVIDIKAFYNCTALSTVSSSSSSAQISVNPRAFQSCTGLTSVSFNGAASLIPDYNYDTGRQFYGCSKLSSITFKKGTTEIPAYAFYGCSSLRTAAFSVVSRIDTEAFADCTALKTFSLSSASPLTVIGDNAFINCKSLTSINIPVSIASIGEYAFCNCSSLTATGLTTKHTKLTGIGTGAFKGCGSLVQFTVPNSVTTIGSSAFYNCTSLKSVNFRSKKATIGSRAFAYCTALTSISLPEGVNLASTSYASDGTFRGCTSLKSASIGNGLTELPSGLFYDCKSLKYVSLPESLITIGSSAFYNCNSLLDTGIEDTEVVTIQSSAFEYCKALTAIRLPGTVSSLGNYAFYGCSSLKKITIPASVTSIESLAFYGTSSDKVIYGSKGSYAETYAKNNKITFVDIAGCYTLRFHPNGGTGYMPDVTDMPFSDSKQLPKNTYKMSGKVLMGWTLDQAGTKTLYKDQASVTGLAKKGKIATLYAQWGYAITYKNILTTDTNSNPASYNEKTVPVKLSSPVRTGYTFGGWYSDSALTKRVKKISDVSAGKITLYAKWTANTYKVVLKANGGKGSDKTYTKTYGKSFTLKNPGFTKSDYVLGGWNTKANGKGTAYTAVEALKNLTATKGKTVTLYAQWVKTQSIKLSSVSKYKYNQNKLSFTAGGTCTGVEIWRSTKKSSGFKKIATVKSSKSVYYDKTAVSGTTYYYKVRTYYTYGGANSYSAYSDVKKVKTAAMPSFTQMIYYQTGKNSYVTMAIKNTGTASLTVGGSADLAKCVFWPTGLKGSKYNGNLGNSSGSRINSLSISKGTETKFKYLFASSFSYSTYSRNSVIQYHIQYDGCSYTITWDLSGKNSSFTAGSSAAETDVYEITSDQYTIE